MEKIIELLFDCECKEGLGNLIIYGFNFPKTAYDPLGKIWSSVRKRIYEIYKVSVVACFFYKKNFIACTFHLNTIPIEAEDKVYDGNEEQSTKAYLAKFRETFERQMMFFEEVLDAYVLDQENGYTAFCNYVKETDGEIDHSTCEEMFNRFLKSMNIKTEEDIKKKEERQKELQKIARILNTNPFEKKPAD